MFKHGDVIELDGTPGLVIESDEVAGQYFVLLQDSSCTTYEVDPQNGEIDDGWMGRKIELIRRPRGQEKKALVRRAMERVDRAAHRL